MRCMPGLCGATSRPRCCSPESHFDVSHGHSIFSEKLFWKDIENTALVAASAPPGGGRNPITKRLSRHFHMLCMPPSTDLVRTHAVFSPVLHLDLLAHAGTQAYFLLFTHVMPLTRY
jgi:hypothetical protein